MDILYSAISSTIRGRRNSTVLVLLTVFIRQVKKITYIIASIETEKDHGEMEKLLLIVPAVSTTNDHAFIYCTAKTLMDIYHQWSF